MKITFLVSGSVRSNFSYRAVVLARSLHTLGHDVSIIAPAADKYSNFIPEIVASIDGVRILQPFQFATKRLEINFLPYLLSAIRILLKEKPDLVYIYKATPISVIGLLAKVFRRAKIIADFDDLGSKVMKIEGHPWYQRRLVQWSENMAARYADRIVVASTYLCELYSKRFPSTPIHIMPNGIESTWLAPTTPSEKPRRIAFMGAINRKNILEPLFDCLPDIIHKHSDIEVLVIGDGRYLPYFKEKAAALHIAKNITYTGWLSIEEARTRLHAGDIGYSYMPNEMTTRAASNMKVPQYMARAVVPLVSDVGDLAATVDFGKAGYVCKPDDMQSLKDTLLYALEDTDRLRKAAYARLFVSNKLNGDDLTRGFDQWICPRKDGPSKVYVVATTVPGNVGGAEIRNYNLIKQLIKQTNVDIEVFCISPKNIEIERKNFESTVNARCHIVHSRPRSFQSRMLAMLLERMPPSMDDFKSSGIGDVFRKACEESLPDIVHIEQLHAYYCIRPHIPWLKSKGVRIVFDCHNIEFQSFKDAVGISFTLQKLVGKYIVPHLKKLEIEAIRLSDIILVCSSIDADFFILHNPRTYIVPNGVDCSEFHSTSKGSKPSIVFMGGVEYPPNADAMRFYLSNIHPKVKERIPSVELLAIGTDEKWLADHEIHDGSIKPLGFVDDVRPFLNQASIGICPIRYGSGTRIKIMTYMAAGLPVVSTKKGAEGANYSDGRDIIIADDPQEFADAISRLWSDQGYREKISTNARNLILKHYDWNVIGKDLGAAYDTLFRYDS